MAVLKVLLVMTLVVAAAVAVNAMEEDKPAKKVKAPRKLVAPKMLKAHHFMPRKNVIIVPKGDPRARPPSMRGFPTIHKVISPAAPKKPKRRIFQSAAPGAGCVAIKGQCIAKNACTGANSIHSGLCPGATYCCVPATPIPAGGIGATLATAANKVCASYHASRAVYSQPRRQFGMSVKFSDCSSFVQSVFEQAGYPDLFGRANAQTSAMRGIIQKRGGGYHKNAQLGDIVMWAAGSTGHVGIITKVCTPTTYQLTAMGNHGCGPYPLGAGSPCMTWQQMTAYGEGGLKGFQGYWTVQ